MSNRSRNWCFTLNNYTGDHVAFLRGVRCRYMVFGREVGKSGTPHLQGYVMFDHQKTLSAAKRNLPGNPHLEEALGTPHQAAMYCKKGEQSSDEWKAKKTEGPNYGRNAQVIEFGRPPTTQEQNGIKGGEAGVSYWTEVNALAKAGNFDELEERFPREYLLHRDKFLRAYHEAKAKAVPRFLHPATTHLWLWGKPGYGKTMFAKMYRSGSCYLKKISDPFWQNYKYEEIVFLDEIDVHDRAHIAAIKELCDIHSITVPVKHGDNMIINPKLVIIASNYPPDVLCMDEISKEALLRRFTIVEFGPDAYRFQYSLNQLVPAVDWFDDVPKEADPDSILPNLPLLPAASNSRKRQTPGTSSTFVGSADKMPRSSLED